MIRQHVCQEQIVQIISNCQFASFMRFFLILFVVLITVITSEMVITFQHG